MSDPKEKMSATIHLSRKFSYYYDIDEIDAKTWESLMSELDEIIYKYNGYFVNVA